MLIPELFDLQMHHIHCNTVDESMELWKEIKDATGCYIYSEPDFIYQHKYTSGGVVYRVEMKEGHLEDWGWDDRRMYEYAGHIILEFQDVIFSPRDFGEVSIHEHMDICNLFSASEVTT